jgi:DHA2 family multidrug resistance protein
LFTQNLLRFTPTETGLTLMPGGIATACVAILCGRLLNGAQPLVDARILVMIGMFTFIYAMWKLGHLTSVAGEHDARYPLIIRGIALGFLFTPINNVAYANLEPSEAQQASGLINLSRQLGGSFGIAILSTYLDKHIALHRADLVSNTYAANPEFMQRQMAAAAGLMSRGIDSLSAKQGALAVIDRVVTQQASMLAYNDAWKFILLSFLVVTPAVFILRKPQGHAPAGDMH